MAHGEDVRLWFALWTDSTYARATNKRLFDIATQTKFSLMSISHDYGAGLVTRGYGWRSCYTAAPIVVVEMGYNDPKISEGDPREKMQAQPWFSNLREARVQVELVIFLVQPEYKQCFEVQKQGKYTRTPGEVVQPGPFLKAAAALVQEELALKVHILERPGEDLFDGFILLDGDLWQDAKTCRSDTANNEAIMWEDAEHPSARGAEEHMRRLIGVLKEELPAAIPNAACATRSIRQTTHDRWLKCFNPSCNYMVHSDPAYGGFCCRKCHRGLVEGSRDSQHGPKCEQHLADENVQQALPETPERPLSEKPIR